MMTKSEMTDLIKQQALNIGFDACGIANPIFLKDDADYLSDWLHSKKQGEMSYMENYFEKRTNPQLLVENARSIIVVLLNYYPAQQQTTDAPQIAKYAYGDDYHYIVKSKLNELKQFIDQHICPTNGVAFCDSAPVLERRWAEQAGLGWIGKNTNLIDPTLGSFFFIGELILDIELLYDKPQAPHCGTCTCCIDACPTKALLEPFNMDASRCISYLTIEKKGEIPVEFHPYLSNCAFGCDICQDVCPWNKKVIPHKTAALSFSFVEMTNDDWQTLSKPSFNKLFKNSALKRAGYKKLMSTIRVLRVE
jgi:epoxyqueuosine reductase